MSANVNMSGSFECYVTKCLAAGPDIRVFVAEIGGALLHALDRYGLVGLAANALPEDSGFPLQAVPALSFADFQWFSAPADGHVLALDAVSAPAVSGADVASDNLDTRVVQVLLRVPRTSSLDKLRSWCVAFGGTFDQLSLSA